MPIEDKDKERERNMFDAAMEEIGRLRAAFRINMMRHGATDKEINEVLYPHAET